MQLNSLQELFVQKLSALYEFEDALITALPKMSSAATSPALKAAFDQHLVETQEHRNRLDQCFSTMQLRPDKVPTPAVKGLIEEGNMVVMARPGSDPDVIDAALIGCAQAVEHHEITCYGTTRAFAEELGYPQIAALLQQNLEEEKAADKKLNQLALGRVNPEASTGFGTTSFGATGA